MKFGGTSRQERADGHASAHVALAHETHPEGAQRRATTDTGGDATPSARPARTFSDPGDGYDSAIRWHADLERGDL